MFLSLIQPEKSSYRLLLSAMKIILCVCSFERNISHSALKVEQSWLVLKSKSLLDKRFIQGEVGEEAKKQQKKTLVLADQFKKKFKKKMDVAFLNSFKISSYTKSIFLLALLLPYHWLVYYYCYPYYGVTIMHIVEQF